MADTNVSVPNVYVSDLENLAKKVRTATGEKNVEISFEFIIASLFPTSWKNIQNDLNRQYTKGYIQGRIDKEEEIKKPRPNIYDDNSDCYCE